MAQSGATDAVRRRAVKASNLLVLAITLAAALWGLWWLYDRLTNTYVLDARVSADMLLLSSQVAGWIVEVPAEESLSVRRGDVLVRVDPRRAQAHFAELQAGVDVLDANIDTVTARIDLMEHRTRSHLDAARARLQASESALAATAGDLEVADAEWQRASALRERNLLSQQEFEEIRNVYRSAVQTERGRQAEVATARADVAEAEADRAEVAVLQTELRALQQRRVQALRQLEQAETELDYYTITSPVNGVIDELFVDPGEHVSPGQRVLVMHDPARLWVKANVKETDLHYLTPGAAVRVSVDAYPDESRRGVIRRIGDAATSQFALLPNPNPSGNFTKVTQRVEVTIDLEEHDPRLKPGMMVEVKIPHG
ncbi:MAG: HlyD family secretion protein [Pseudomonadales bacterium]